MMYSMKEACVQTGMSYETLKFYCKEGLVPNVKRDSHNYRVFDDRDIKWIQSLGCLKRCGMTLAEMKEYLAYCLEGPSSIPERKEILAVKKEALLASMEKLQKAIDYIDWKQNFYDDVLSGKIEYHSNLISDEEIAQKAQSSFLSYAKNGADLFTDQCRFLIFSLLSSTVSMRRLWSYSFTSAAVRILCPKSTMCHRIFAPRIKDP